MRDACEAFVAPHSRTAGIATPVTPAIETPRLRLRGWRDDDVEPWAKMNADPRVMEYFVSPTPRETSYEQAARMRQWLHEHGYGWFVIELKDRAGFAGIVAIDDVRYEVPFQPRREIGWRLPVATWGRGYATEAARALLGYAFETLHWDSVVSFTTARNERSRRVMERLGMTHDPAENFEHPRVPEGHPIRPHVLYRLNAADLSK
ncbi:MAG: GNAT family N-acetyltransferase [Candidatus Eremiobacteraeota bacterium]|nr:GNAT family N-acetyltransferase [Candidatus Eremiobacteraeota bacterium]